MLLVLLSYVAGLLVSISPCVLPILPLVVGGASSKHRLGPAAMAAGLVSAFVLIGLLVATVGVALGISGESVRTGGALMLLLAGALLMLPVGGRISAWLLSRVATRAGEASDHLGASTSLTGQFGVGALLGAVWAPCAGPVLGGAIGLAAQEGFSLQAGLQMMAFGLGTVTPLLGLAYGARALIERHRNRMLNWSAKAKPAFGLMLLAAGVLVLTGLDAHIQELALSFLPNWFVEFTTSI